MTIQALRILPPLAIGRLGASETPLESYALEIPPGDPLGTRRIAPRLTLAIDRATGEIARSYVPEKIVFRDGAAIRPVAPFLEVFALTDAGVLEPLTFDLLRQDGIDPGSLRWKVHVANIKAFRRTGKVEDQIHASATFGDHVAHDLLGACPNFRLGATLPLGSVQYIKPNADFPEVRLRFTPASGWVYGASSQRIEVEGKPPVDDPVFARHSERIVYREGGPWHVYEEGAAWNPWFTNPSQIFAGYAKADGTQVSWGYLDDECDGIVTVEVETARGLLAAFGRIGAGPPAFAPDSLPVRTVADDLLQALLGPEVSAADVSKEDALDIVRRAFETVRLINTTVMNGNEVYGRINVASTMARQDSYVGRLFEPIMAPSIVDNLALLALHRRVYAALESGTAPWFAQVLRRPEEVGDLTDTGRRKMPALMRGADSRYMALTRRMIDTIIKLAQAGGEKSR